MNALPQPLRLLDHNRVPWRRRKLLYFGGCDYLRLSRHPKVGRALQDGLRQHGLNVAASRTTTGNHPLFEQLEAELARFFHAPAATLVSSGYVSNLIVAQALAGEFTHALLDERAHTSLQDAARWLGCPIHLFRHRSPPDLARTLRRCGRSQRLLLATDGLFSHDGSVAPLQEYRALLPAKAWMLVDDAHGAGVLGATGQGTLQHLGLTRHHIIQTVTLSKAFGVYGGAILGPERLRLQILARSNLFRGATPMPLPLVSAASQSLQLVRHHPVLQRRLHRNSDLAKAGLRDAGLRVPDFPGPILSMIPRNRRQAARLERALLAEGIHPPRIRYPGGPAEGYFRFAISSEHTPEQIQALVRALRRGLQLAPPPSRCGFRIA